ncbi:hypothetical protein PPNK14_14080 [Pectobacterium parmentieri]
MPDTASYYFIISYLGNHDLPTSVNFNASRGEFVHPLLSKSFAEDSPDQKHRINPKAAQLYRLIRSTHNATEGKF